MINIQTFLLSFLIHYFYYSFQIETSTPKLNSRLFLSRVLCAMKDPFDKTKIVVRNLPPSISRSALKEQIDSRFSDRYKWFSFRTGKISHKNQRCSRVYIDFHAPEDVIEFAEFFSGRTFVNEKGSQYKVLVEYAPSQSVPKLSSKKDGREGSILKDPDYLEFLEAVAKIENLPSAEIQLERKESEKAGAQKESVIVTPLMDFIRQKRAAKNGSQRISVNGRLSRRAREAVTTGPSSSKRDSEKRRGSTSMYVLRDSAKGSGERKEKTAYTILSRKEDQQSHSASKTEILEAGNKMAADAIGSNGTISTSGGVEVSEKRVLLKGKEKEIPCIVSSSNTTASVRSIPNMTYRQRQQHDASGRTIRSILSNNNKVDQQTQEVNSEKRPPRPPNPHIKSNYSALYNDGKGYAEGSVSTIRNKNEKQQMTGDDAPLSRGEIRSILPNSNRYAESKSGRANYTEKGRHGGSRGKEGDKSSNYSEGKQSKRGVSANYGAYEKQMWVQKPASGP